MASEGVYRRHPASPVALARIAVVAGVLLAAAAGAQAPKEGQPATARGKPARPAWQWTLEERLAARFDPEGMKRRAAREAELAKKTAAQFGERFDIAPGQHSIDGKSEPELFLPGELFNSLLSSAFHENALHQREMRTWIEEHAAVLGFGSDLWVRLERVTAPYLRLRDERNLRALAAASRSEAYEDSAEETRAICRAGAQAFAAAKAEFGEEGLLRLLYEVKAPTMSVTNEVTEGMSDHLRYMEGGCP